MSNVLEITLNMIGDADHTKGNGPNAAIYRGMLLNHIRTLIETELGGEKRQTLRSSEVRQ